MSKPISTTELHYRKRTFRYRVQHWDLNRADRRAGARRDPRNKKLLARESSNVPYIHSVVPNA